MSPTAAADAAGQSPDLRRGGGAVDAVSAAVVLLGLLVVLAMVSAWHITQGTSGIGVRDLIAVMTGTDSRAEAGPSARDILLGSRLPRVGAGILVGIALGVAGALFQSLARNPLASPDTLAVTGGSYFAVTVVTAFGIALPVWASGGVAFVAGLAAPPPVPGPPGGRAAPPTRPAPPGPPPPLPRQPGPPPLRLPSPGAPRRRRGLGARRADPFDPGHRDPAGRRPHRHRGDSGRTDRLRRALLPGHRPPAVPAGSRAGQACRAYSGHGDHRRDHRHRRRCT